ncbi:MAG: hypothetical protein LUB61_03270, partial [Eggerthellaceae bacterium]|nr:hypothetical protein [Eggerthellaceae bacterium]
MKVSELKKNKKRTEKAGKKRRRPELNSERVTLGTGPSGKKLSFMKTGYSFLMGERDISLTDVKKLDSQGKIHWRYMEQRDWMRRLDEETVNKHHSEYLTALALNAPGASAMDAAIAEHVRKDDSYLHGKIVDTNKEEELAALKAALAQAQSSQNDDSDTAEAQAKDSAASKA